MARSKIYKVEDRTLQIEEVIIDCEKCDKEISPEDNEPRYANELIILLNQEQCVNQGFRIDLCTECLIPVWEAICNLINRNPDDISKSDFEDD